MRLTRDQQRLFHNGWLWAAYEGLTASFLPAFAIALGASNTVIGALSSLTFIAVMLGEIPGALLTDYFMRKRIYLVLTSLSRVGWVLVAAAPFIFPQHPLVIVFVGYFLLRFIELAADPAWISLSADLVPVRKRGRFFSKRLRFVGILSMLAAFAGGWYLDLFPKDSFVGFQSLFLVGVIFGIVSSLALRRVHEPEEAKHEHHKWRDFFTVPLRLRSLLLFVMCFNFALMMAAPLVSVFLLRELQLPYIYYAGIGALVTLVKILAFPVIGQLSDRFGDKPLAFLSALCTAFVPFLYLFVTPSTLWVLFPLIVIAGVGWAGVDISFFNLLLGLTTPSRRALETATYNFLAAIPMVVGPVVGGLIADSISIGVFALGGIQIVFLLSFLFRALSATLLAFVEEPRQKVEMHPEDVIHAVLMLHPVRGIQRKTLFFLHKIKRRKDGWFGESR